MSWIELRRVVAERILKDAHDTSAELTRLGVPHALVGGLAVGMHGHARATKDVDFIVGPAAFATTTPLLSYREEVGKLVRWGKVDLIAALEDDPALHRCLRPPSQGTIDVIELPALVLMKLRASRPQDIADVVALLRAGADPATILDYMEDYEPTHVPRMVTLIQETLG